MARRTRFQRRRQAVVAGIHALPFSKDIGMTERRAGALAILGALADAGLGVADVDGMYRFVWENTTEMEMARILGVPNLRMFGEVDYGGGAGAGALALRTHVGRPMGCRQKEMPIHTHQTTGCAWFTTALSKTSKRCVANL